MLITYNIHQEGLPGYKLQRPAAANFTEYVTGISQISAERLKDDEKK